MMYRVNDVLSAKKSELDGYKVDTGLTDQTVLQYYSSAIAQGTMLLQQLQKQYDSISDKNSDEAVKLDETIEKLQEHITTINQRIAESNPSVLRRAISLPQNDLTGDDFLGALPVDFSSDANVAITRVSDLIGRVDSYLEHLKTTKTILAEDNPIITNLFDTVARSYRNHIRGIITKYKNDANALSKRNEQLPLLEEVLNLTYSVDESGIDSKYAELNSDVRFGDIHDSDISTALQLYNLKWLKALRNKLAVASALNLTMSDQETAHLNEHADMSDADLDAQIALREELLNTSVEEIGQTNFNDLTKRAFVAIDGTYNQIDGEGKLESLITDLIETIRTDPSNIQPKVNAIKSEIDRLTEDETTRNQLKADILGNIESEARKMADLKRKEGELTPSPVSDLLE